MMKGMALSYNHGADSAVRIVKYAWLTHRLLHSLSD